MDKIDVLDHGFVRLIDHKGDDLLVVRAARISHNAAWRAGEDVGSDARLIRYLWRHAHTSPFEHVVFTFEVKAPIFVLRQWHRHRTWHFSELSGRYRELPEEFYVPSPKHLGTQSKDNKQARVIKEEEPKHPDWVSVEIIQSICEMAFTKYRTLLERGVPRELARSVLPVATYSHMFATVDLLNLLKFFTLRSDPHAQWEIQQFSNAMLDLIRPIVPVCVAAWEGNR